MPTVTSSRARMAQCLLPLFNPDTAVRMRQIVLFRKEAGKRIAEGGYSLPQLQLSLSQLHAQLPQEPQLHCEDSLQLPPQSSEQQEDTDFILLKAILSAIMYPFMNARSSFSSIDFRSSSLLRNISAFPSCSSFTSFIIPPIYFCSLSLYS